MNVQQQQQVDDFYVFVSSNPQFTQNASTPFSIPSDFVTGLFHPVKLPENTFEVGLAEIWFKSHPEEKSNFFAIQSDIIQPQLFCFGYRPVLRLVTNEVLGKIQSVRFKTIQYYSLEKNYFDFIRLWLSTERGALAKLDNEFGVSCVLHFRSKQLQ